MTAGRISPRSTATGPRSPNAAASPPRLRPTLAPRPRPRPRPQARTQARTRAARPTPRPPRPAALRPAERNPAALTDDQALALLSADGKDLEELARLADGLRREVNGDDVTYVVTRNINFTNVCY